MNDALKEWKLVQTMVGLVAASALGFYIISGNFQVREWAPFLPTPKPPDTLIFHIDAMRQHFRTQRYREALREADWVLAKQKESLEAIRTRAGCLLKLGQFEEAELVFRQLVARDKRDLAARLALATVLRAQGETDEARLILLRLLRDPAADTLQLEAAQASLQAMEEREPLFADQPTPPPPPVRATPVPETLPSLTIGAPKETILGIRGERPTPAPLGLGERAPAVNPTPTPEPEVAPRVLKAPEKNKGNKEKQEKQETKPLEIPPPTEKKENERGDEQASG